MNRFPVKVYDSGHVEAGAHLVGQIIVTNLKVRESWDDSLTSSSSSFSFGIGERVAVIGKSGSGRGRLARIIAGLEKPAFGDVSIGDKLIDNLPQTLRGRRIAYLDQDAGFFEGTVRDNLVYGLKRRPVQHARYAEKDAATRRKRALEERLFRHAEGDVLADFIDYESAGVADDISLNDRVVEVLETLKAEQSIFFLGLRGTFDIDPESEFAARILKARYHLRQRLNSRQFDGLVQPFEREKFNQNMSLAENMLFGRPIGAAFRAERIADNPYVRMIVDKVGLTNTFSGMGLRVAKVMLDLLEDLPLTHELYSRFSFPFSRVQRVELRTLVQRVDNVGLSSAEAPDLSFLMSLSFQTIPAQHRLGLVDEVVERQILEARHLFSISLPEGLRNAIAFFQPDKFNVAASIEDNILLAR